MEDSAGSTPPAIVTIVYMLIFVTVVLDWMLLVDFMTEFAIKSIQCFSYRRFCASPDASSLIWTQVERFGRFFQVQFSMRLLRCRNHRNQNRSTE